MNADELREQVLSAWISLNGMLKDSRMTDALTYNEAIVMKLIYDRYRQEGEERTPVSYLVKATNSLKSLMNRTLGSLCEQGFLKKEREGRNLYVRLELERLPGFLAVHARSLEMVRQIIDVIGMEDAQAFVRIAAKLRAAELKL